MVRFRTKCPKCLKTKFWKIADNRLKCKNCYYKFTPKNNLIQLRQLISEFSLEHSTNIILERVKISKYKLLKILTLLRMEMTKDIPEVFEGIVEVDETYLGGQMRNKRKEIKIKLGKNRRGFGTVKQP
ncbi:hypothetical protein HKBW3S42_02222, partial [Candidatus Hakubella thermalkaliphila]